MDIGQREKKKNKLEHWMIIAICLMVWDFISLHFSYFAALWLRFDCVYSAIPEKYLYPYFHFITAYAVGAIALFWLFKMYRGVWRYASYSELEKTVVGSTTASVLHIFLISILFGRMPLSYHLWGAVLQLILLGVTLLLIITQQLHRSQLV